MTYSLETNLNSFINCAWSTTDKWLNKGIKSLATLMDEIIKEVEPKVSTDEFEKFSKLSKWAEQLRNPNATNLTKEEGLFESVIEISKRLLKEEKARTPSPTRSPLDVEVTVTIVRAAPRYHS